MMAIHAVSCPPFGFRRAGPGWVARMDIEVWHSWHDFFVAEASASAALAGLLFVAVSINLTRILEFPQLPIRAIEALSTLLSVLLVATFFLIPGQSGLAYGIEIGASGLLVWIGLTIALLRTRKFRHPDDNVVLRLVMNQAPPLPFIVAGALMAYGNPTGIYWVVPGVILSLSADMILAWVLLIEIQR